MLLDKVSTHKLKTIFLSTAYIYLFLLSVWIDLLSRNFRQLNHYLAIRSILICMFLVLPLILIFYLRYKNWYWAGFSVFVLSILVFYSGQFITLLENKRLLNNGGHLFIVIITGLILAYMLLSHSPWSIIRNEKMVAFFLNLVFALNLAFLLIMFVLVHPNTEKVVLKQNPEEPILSQSIKLINPPDIYYIVLDGYGREDVLNGMYGFSNRSFIYSLEKKGFVIGDQSSSNYLQTALSISSSLNLNYLQNLVTFDQRSDNREPIRLLISDNFTRNLLQKTGYKFVSFDTGFYFTDVKNADLYYSSYWDLNSFDQLILTQSIFKLIGELVPSPIPLSNYETHRGRITYAFDQIIQLPNTGSPKFVFAHILSPHPPFVFDAKGNAVQPDRSYSYFDANRFEGLAEEYRTGYTQQISYLNSRLLPLVDRLIDQSVVPPIIILQGDHGPRLFLDEYKLENTCIIESSSIFNAYYLPEEIKDRIYPTITPVNTFRVILTELFDLNLNLLPDTTYYSTSQNPYDFIDVDSQRNIDCHLLKP